MDILYLGAILLLTVLVCGLVAACGKLGGPA
jgi:hypothetical protein